MHTSFNSLRLFSENIHNSFIIESTARKNCESQFNGRSSISDNRDIFFALSLHEKSKGYKGSP